MSKQKIAIGIDPGTKTGFSVLDIASGTFIEVSTLRIDQALFKAVEYMQTHDCFFIVEDARKRRWFKDSGMTERERNGLRQGAGSVKRDSSIWEDFLKARGAIFEMIPPKKGTTKYDAAYFKRLTGWEKITSEHGRDAGMKVWGINPRNLRLTFRQLQVKNNSLSF